MKRTLLIISLVLMTVSLTAPFWTRWIVGFTPLHWIRGRVTGKFADQPWAGTFVNVGDERSIIKADGKFDFSVPPGVYVVRVCCSERFEPIRREVKVAENDLYLELKAEPLLEIRGHLIVPEGTQLENLPTISVRRIYTKTKKSAVVSAVGTFSLHLYKGDWKVDLENTDPELKLKSMTFDGKELDDQTLTIANQQESKLLEITLQ